MAGSPAPLLRATITLIAQSDLTQAFDSQRRDEVGDLVREVEGMRQSADAALQTQQLSASAVDVASHGGQVAGQVVSIMGEISGASKDQA